MKKFRSIVAFLLVFVLLSSSFTTACASDVMPIFDNCASCGLDFYVSGDYAYVIIDYIAYNNTFTNMEASVKIQKRFLGIFWSTVDIGWPDNTWTVSSTETDNFLSATFTVTEEGTYRAVFDVRFYGTTGETDVIQDKMEYTYSK